MLFGNNGFYSAVFYRTSRNDKGSKRRFADMCGGDNSFAFSFYGDF